MKNFIYESLPKGWFQVGWSSDFEIGKAYPLSYFGSDQVAFRTRSGSLVILDAHCKHMGAHLGHGGRVKDDCIACPFHGWTWGADGSNGNIPYGKVAQMRVSTRVWPVRELNGVVLVWNCSPGIAPEWEPTSFTTEEATNLWPIDDRASYLWRNVKLAPQLVPENSVDNAHLHFVHGAPCVPDMVFSGEDGHRFRTELVLNWGEGRAQSWVSPNGPVRGSIVFECHGVGLVAARLMAADQICLLVATTPIDRERSDQRLTMWIPRKRLDGSPLNESVRDEWFRYEYGQMQGDIKIWENLSYKAAAIFTRTELGPFKKLRKWAKQFYDIPSVKNASVEVDAAEGSIPA